MRPSWSRQLALLAIGSRLGLVADCGRNDRWEGAILGLTAEISQISGVPGLGVVVNLFLYLGGIRKIGCLCFCARSAFCCSLSADNNQENGKLLDFDITTHLTRGSP
jgi:hypothetical protein